MQGRKVLLLVLINLFTATLGFGQSEAFKVVVNNLAYYKQKKDLKYLAGAKTSVDSLITTKKDSLDLGKNIYKAVVYTSILYIDSLNKLKQPANFLDKTTALVDRLSGDKKLFKYQSEMEYSKRCLANVYIRRGFAYMHNMDYLNAIEVFKKAQNYTPSFKQLNGYIAYANSKVGNMPSAALYYGRLLKADTTRAESFETAADIYRSIGDTAKSLEILQRAHRYFPQDRFILLDLANVYHNRHDYRSLEPLLVPLLDAYSTNADVANIAANCYDHLNKYQKAESMYLRTIELNGAMYDPAFNLGLLYLKRGVSKQNTAGLQDLSRAEQWLGKANEMSPNDAHCLQLLQLLYRQTGDAAQLEKVNNKLKQLTN